MKALIAMSGGVDSSVAAKLVCDAGMEAIGCTMKLYDNEDVGLSRAHACCSLDDVEDARSVAYRLGIPYYVFNFRDAFEQKVIRPFIESYERGITPNPCIDCNKYLKFEALYDRARVLGCDVIVTGHYAVIEEKDGQFFLKKAVDPFKDQSYVLYDLTQERLRHTLFPLGGLSKAQTRKIAEENGFVNADKPDSQDICFVPDGDYAAVIERHTGKKAKPGNFVDRDGRVLGRHRGIVHYTVGQRKGLGIAFGEPMYVCGISARDNTVILGKNEDLFGRFLTVREMNWIAGEPPAGAFRCGVKIRYRQKEQPAKVTVLGRGRIAVAFDEPQRAITPGQSAVLYNGDIVLGGGLIEEANDSPGG